MGIEPTSEAWEALNKTLKAIDLAALSFPSDGLSWKLDGKRNQTSDGNAPSTICGPIPTRARRAVGIERTSK